MMARIRSCFPGQWTDEDFVECSPLARLLAIGLRNEADDHGVFEWKPRALKMRLLPADDSDISDLLSELSAHRQILPYEVDGKAYGAIRNFVLWQRPKKPKAVHPITPEVRDWVGMNRRSKAAQNELVEDQSESGSEPAMAETTDSSAPVLNLDGINATSRAVSSVPVPHRYGTGTEFAVQREEVGGRREEDISSRVDESSAGGSAVAGGSGQTAAAIVQDFGSGAVDAVFVMVEMGVENWFDVTRNERSIGDTRIIRDWLSVAETAGMTAPDALALIGDVVDRQLKRLSEKPKQSAPFSLAMLTKDVNGAIATARRGPPQVADAPKVTVGDRAPPPFDTHFSAVQWASWIKPCAITKADRRAVIVAPAALTADRLRQHHDHDLRECLGVDEIDFQVAPRVKPAKSGGTSATIIPHPATVAEASK
ncbi:hypothetical protein D3877_16220 [Azospirillum cavernae]|uniref:DnaA N-terminal domain-containing protein n=1 Tax=Azospirillum cavernae TaxID=2320860 RepID=A0A418VWW1_9PROT|nr:hypothetical protein [Azospirillum cavernae]RJF81668.1 hypothetical protein D3877_16220 [Azospirillum cavernae]